MRIRVYVVDDLEAVRRGLSDLLGLEDDLEVVGDSGNTDEALREILSRRPDVIVLDTRLPDGSGIEVCRDARSVDPTITGLVLTSLGEDEALLAVMMAGASGYVLKKVRGSDLVDGIRQAAAGRCLLDPAITARALEQLRQGLKADPHLQALTEPEQRVLGLIADGMTNREIGEEMLLTENTVRQYVSSLLTKFGMRRPPPTAHRPPRSRTSVEGHPASVSRPADESSPGARPQHPAGRGRGETGSA